MDYSRRNMLGAGAAIGAAGIAFAGMHAVVGTQEWLRGTTAGSYTASFYAGHVVGVCIGVIVAVLCFRPPSQRMR